MLDEINLIIYLIITFSGTVFGSFFNSCRVFPVFGNECENCGHTKYWHELHQNRHYVNKYEKKKIPNDDKKENETNNYNKKKDEIKWKMFNYKLDKVRDEEELKHFNREKNEVQNSLNYYINEKNKADKEGKQLSKKIYNMISNLIDISNNLEKNSLNKFQFEIENEYIDHLIEQIQMKEKYKNKDKIEKLVKRKQINVLYQEFTSNYFYLFGFKCSSIY